MDPGRVGQVSISAVGAGPGGCVARRAEEGAGHGIDGEIRFRDDSKASKAEQIIIQVKGGKTGVKDVRDLRGVWDRENAAMGVLISLQPPTRDMVAEAVSASFYEHKTFQEVTHWTTGIYVLFSAPTSRGLCAPDRVR